MKSKDYATEERTSSLGNQSGRGPRGVAGDGLSGYSPPKGRREK